MRLLFIIILLMLTVFLSGTDLHALVDTKSEHNLKSLVEDFLSIYETETTTDNRPEKDVWLFLSRRLREFNFNDNQSQYLGYLKNNGSLRALNIVPTQFYNKNITLSIADIETAGIKARIKIEIARGQAKSIINTLWLYEHNSWFYDKWAYVNYDYDASDSWLDQTDEKELGEVTIACEPGADIYLDGNLVGSTSRTVKRLLIPDLPIGTYEIKVTKVGMMPITRKVKIRKIAGEIPKKLLTFKFKKLGSQQNNPTDNDGMGSLKITSVPGADIFLDGKLIGRTSESQRKLIINDIPAGRHIIRGVKDGFKAGKKTRSMTSINITIKKDKQLEVNISFK